MLATVSPCDSPSDSPRRNMIISFRALMSPGRRNSIQNTPTGMHPRRLSTGNTEYLMMNFKSKTIISLDDDVSITKKNYLPKSQRLLQVRTVNMKMEDCVDTEKPIRKECKVDDDETEVASTSSSSSSSGNFDECDSDSERSSHISHPSKATIHKRTVRFPIDADGTVRCQVHYLSKEDAAMVRQCPKRDLWWSKKDRTESRNAAQARIQLMTQCNPAFRAAFIQLVTSVGGFDFSGNTTLPPKLTCWFDEKARSDSYAVKVLSRSSDASRGLERMLFRVMELPQPKYRQSVKQLIAMQNHMKASGCCTPDLIQGVLATQYMRDTSGAAAMALFLAQSDVITAQQSCSSMVHI